MRIYIIFVVGLIFFLSRIGIILAKNEGAPGQQKKQEKTTLQAQKAASDPGQPGTPKALKEFPPGILKKIQPESTGAAIPKMGVGKLKDTLTSLGQNGKATPPGLLKKLTKIGVFTASPSAQSKRHAVSGIITGVNGNTLTIAHLIQRDRTYTVLTDAATIVTGKEGATLAIGVRIAAVGTPTAGGILAKRIHIIPGRATGALGQNPLPSTSLTVSATPNVSISPTITSAVTEASTGIPVTPSP